MWEYEELTQHLWSLPVEEQFYLIWPPLYASALPRRRAEALVVGVLVRRGFAADGSLRFRLDTRGLGILLGCAVSLSIEGADRPRLAALLGRPGLRRALAALLAASLAWVSWLATRGRIGEVTVDRYVIPPLDLGFALLVAMLWRGPPDGLARALSWRPLAALGTISYGLYLYHMAARLLIWRVLTPGMEGWPRLAKYPLRLALYLGLTAATAAASYALVERPFLRLKERLR